MNRVTKINLSNLKNCNQVWIDMPEYEKGRLCLKCSNTIIDFRNMSDSQIAKTHLFSEQKVCGLYKKEQLQKPIKISKTFKFNRWNSFYFNLFSFLSLNSFGQEKTKQVKTEQTENKFDTLDKKVLKETIENHSIVKDSIFISGKLTNENNEPLPFGNVIIKGTQVGTTSDFEGLYRLNITKELVAKAYKAECTPDFFVFDGNLSCVYRGRFDETRPGKNPATGIDLSNALNYHIEGNQITSEQKPSMGCNIKWK